MGLFQVQGVLYSRCSQKSQTFPVVNRKWCDVALHLVWYLRSLQDRRSTLFSTTLVWYTILKRAKGMGLLLKLLFLVLQDMLLLRLLSWLMLLGLGKERLAIVLHLVFRLCWSRWSCSLCLYILSTCAASGAGMKGKFRNKRGRMGKSNSRSRRIQPYRP